MLITFSFCFQTDDKTGTFAGNIDPVMALAILQALIYADIKAKVKGDGKAELEVVTKGGKENVL